MNEKGEVLLSPDEFDEMKVFYQDLTNQGYGREIIDNVYEFFKNPQGSDKHKIVVEKVFEYNKQQMKSNGQTEDLTVLADFLQNNDLNTRSIDWYKKADFTDIIKQIRKSVGIKTRQKARKLLFENPADTVDKFGLANRGIAGSIEEEKEIKRRPHKLLDNFFTAQLSYTIGKSVDARSINREVANYRKAAVDMLFKKTSSDRILEIAGLFSEQKNELMRKIWEEVWREIEDSPELDKFAKWKDIIVPATTGSVGRGEVVIGSDLDYLIYVDDREKVLEKEDIDELSSFINNVLATKVNDVITKNGIKADAGLARGERQPFTLLSTVRDFDIDFDQRMQKEEPTNIVDNQALFPEGENLVGQAKTNLLIENDSAHLLGSYISSDLEIGSEKFGSFSDRFEELFKKAASGGLLEEVKRSLQRTVNFKTYQLLFDSFNNGSIPKEKAAQVPASTVGKLNMLAKHGVLTPTEVNISKDLLAVAYKIRFLSELYTVDESKYSFRLDSFSYEERVNLIKLLKDYKSQVLYK